MVWYAIAWYPWGFALYRHLYRRECIVNGNYKKAFTETWKSLSVDTLGRGGGIRLNTTQEGFLKQGQVLRYFLKSCMDNMVHNSYIPNQWCRIPSSPSRFNSVTKRCNHMQWAVSGCPTRCNKLTIPRSGYH